ncbi:MAG: hypothetical protein COV52_08710 [Gammaproteobacteria bacterium CG11_big_fil_rev_8_21_14_0_20_46_22]|nr:MAG: hypothetical protein COW05_01180 [Gammaproteobacteria bacterium CG12_big_fil_rev_8_21_14_0_65_46_12]PIR10572.1 MAG: hypothetical protein COV52_08710 [Gammaproteobacteria bacterium CG11_big_fil_rev_8_21_14_0_20_46_22]
MKIKISTRNAIQVATAVLLTVLLTDVFHLPRSYWATLTAFLLVAQTFGESVKKSAERIGMTILGCIAGSLLFIVLQHHTLVLLGCICLCTFCISYYFSVSYGIGVFFITMMVVFIFGMINTWNTALLEARIIETLIGAAIALLSSALVLPISAKQQLKDAIPEYISACKLSFNTAADKTIGKTFSKVPTKLLSKFQALQHNAKLIRYENLFGFLSKEKFERSLFELRMLAYHLGTAYDIAENLHDKLNLSLIHTELESLFSIVNTNFDRLTLAYQGKRADTEFEAIDHLHLLSAEKLTNCLKSTTQEPDYWFKFYAFLYATRRINATIGELIKLTH